MINCPQCHIELSKDTQFCPECGARQNLSGYTCAHCGRVNLSNTEPCYFCHLPISETGQITRAEQSTSYKAKYPLDFGETVRLPFQLRTFFLKALKVRLEATGNSIYFDDYVNRFYDSAFLKTFDEAAVDMAEQSYLLHADQSPEAEREVDQYLDEQFELLMSRFFLEEGPTVKNNPVAKESMYFEGREIGLTEMKQLVVSQLNLGEEQEKWYNDLDRMPKLKLQNARDFFLFTEPDEQVFIICDQTIFGSCREGFAMTNKALYWKAHFNKAQKISYKDIESLELSAEWLVINGQYFNATPAINVKMLHLLEKLKG